MGNACPIDGRPQSEVQVGPDKLEVVASFCYLGNMLSAGGGCEITVTTRGEVQGATTSSHILPPLLQETVAMYTAFACRVPCSMPVKLGH